MSKEVELTIINKNSIDFLIRKVLGIDRAVAYYFLSKGSGLVTAPVMIWLITTHFTPQIQGYHYTFASLIYLQVFFELGFAMVMLQFVSNEWAHLKIGPQGHIEGDPNNISCLASLVRLGMKWYFSIAVLFVPIIGSAGYFFLSQTETNIAFQKPWWILCLTVSFSILIIPMRCCLEGSNRMAKSQLIIFISYFLSTVAGCGAIILGAQLYTLAIINGISATINFLLLFPTFIPFYRISKQKKWDRNFLEK